MEELHSVLEQTLVKGQVQVIDMPYSNIAAINQFVYFKESDHSEIFEQINLKFKENFAT